MESVALLSGYLNIGGAEKLLVSLAEELLENNKKVIVITIKGGALQEYLINKGIKVYNLRSGKKFSYKTLRELIKILKRENIKVAHSHSFNAHVYCVMAKYFVNFKHIHTEHSVIANKKLHQKMLDNILINKTDRVVACSEYVFSNLNNYYKNNKKFCYVNNGIDIDKFFSEEKSVHFIGKN